MGVVIIVVPDVVFIAVAVVAADVVVNRWSHSYIPEESAFA